MTTTLEEEIEEGWHFADCHLVADRVTHEHYCPTCPGCTCAQPQVANLVRDLQTIADLGTLPDGDHVSQPIQMWVEQVLGRT